VPRLLSYNICRGGKGREAHLERVIATVAPDVVVFQEATAPAVIEQLARSLAMPHWGARPGESLGYMSRLPLAHAEWHSPRLSRHAFLELVVEGSGMRIYGVHLSAVFSAWTERRRAYELRALLASIKRRDPGFHVLTGDFNTLAPDSILDLAKLPRRIRTAMWLSGGNVRWRAIKMVLEAGYSDAFRALHPSDPGYTLPSTDPHVRLDFLFVPGVFVDRVTRCEVVADPEGRAASDHLPLVSEITL
jgi:exodeoxyribonuclease-3